MQFSRIAASACRLIAAFAVAASSLVALGQEPSPTPAPTPGRPAEAKKEDVVPRSRKEAGKQETTAATTGKGAAAEKAEKEKQAKEHKGGWTSETLAGLELRSIGPAATSGRVVDLAVDPTNPSRWFVASADGGVWRT
ncbi:MAG TPA: hypothetical protein VKE50_11040, partial [Thermoanaerobaculia bacterium]|nr:hypothetical protein [Thermoanaerobaculia bacterium]